MTTKKLFITLFTGGSILVSGFVFPGCASMSYTGKGAAIGAGSGAAVAD